MSDTPAVPAFVKILRAEIPKAGIEFPTTEPKKVSRLKRKIKKDCEKAGYNVESVRGLGITLDNKYGIEYTSTVGDTIILKADVMEAGALLAKQPETKSRSGGSRKTRVSTLPGEHPTTKDWSNLQYGETVARMVAETLDVDMATPEEVKSNRWHCWQVSVLRLHGKTPDEIALDVVRSIQHQVIPADKVALLIPPTHRELPAKANILIGVGPSEVKVR